PSAHVLPPTCAACLKAEVAFDRVLVQDELQPLQTLIETAGNKATFSHVVKTGDEHSLKIKLGQVVQRLRDRADKEQHGLLGVAAELVRHGLDERLEPWPSWREQPKCWSSCDSTRRTCIPKQLAAMGLRDGLECINALCYLDQVALESADQNELVGSEVDKWGRLLIEVMHFSLPAMFIHTVFMCILFMEMMLMTPVLNAVTLMLLLLFLLATLMKLGVGW
ncbi:hypothetical protein PR001_g26965, partial [Phytophthora rubi]